MLKPLGVIAGVALLSVVGGAVAFAVQRPKTRAPYHLDLGPMRAPIDAAVPSAFDANGKRVTMRVCADPNNLPFSNDKGAGFENKLASLVAHDLGLGLEYSWLPQRRGFVRNTLKLENCDVIMGIASASELVMATRPYYRSTYVFVSRHDRHLGVHSFDDPKLRHMKIAVHLTGGDDANPPAAKALAERGLAANVVGFPIYGNYDSPDPTFNLLDAIVAGKVDVGVVWGPLAGYYAKSARVPLDVAPVHPQIELPYLPFVYDVSVGVRRGDSTWRNELQGALDRHAADIQKILTDYGVPLEPLSIRGGGQQ